MARILVVDDEPANRQLVASILQPHGHEVFAAANAADALRDARDACPDLIIVDLFLPGKGGVDLIKTLRADPPTREAKIALYTASQPDRALRDFMESNGIVSLIPKPSEPGVLLRIVNDALAT